MWHQSNLLAARGAGLRHRHKMHDTLCLLHYHCRQSCTASNTRILSLRPLWPTICTPSPFRISHGITPPYPAHFRQLTPYHIHTRAFISLKNKRNVYFSRGCRGNGNGNGNSNGNSNGNGNNSNAYTYTHLGYIS